MCPLNAGLGFKNGTMQISDTYSRNRKKGHVKLPLRGTAPQPDRFFASHLADLCVTEPDPSSP